MYGFASQLFEHLVMKPIGKLLRHLFTGCPVVATPNGAAEQFGLAGVNVCGSPARTRS